MPRHAAPLPPEFDAPFATRDALAAGITPARLRSGDLERPFWGVRTRRRERIVEADGIRDLDAEAHVARARAYATRMPATQFPDVPPGMAA